MMLFTRWIPFVVACIYACKCEEEYVDTLYSVNSELFSLIREKTFVDKSEIIFEFFRRGTPNYILLTAPRGFGKTTNMDTIAQFAALPLMKNGSVANANKTRAYNIFRKMNIFKKNETFFHKHFAKYLVIRVEMIFGSGAVAMMKKIIELMYEHLRGTDRGDDLIQDVKMGRITLDMFIFKLELYLRHKYPGLIKDTILLVDEYDTQLAQDMINTKCDAEKIIDTAREIGKFVRFFSKSSNTRFHRMLITGISTCLRMAEIDSHDWNEVIAYPFWEEHRFNKFYGFNKNEVQTICKENGIGEEEMNKMLNYYMGYDKMDGEQYCNPFSITQYIRERKFKSYWEEFGQLNVFTNTLNITEIRETIYRLTDETDKLNNEVGFEIVRYLQRRGLENLKNLFAGKIMQSDAEFTNAVENYWLMLLELGYLSVTRMIPNNEIRGELRKRIDKYFKNSSTAC